MSDTPLRDINRPFRTFMGAPPSCDLTHARAAILGIPFDCGTHPDRIGSRLGPSAIRERSVLVRPYEPPDNDYNPVELLGLVDCGDVNVVPGDILHAHGQIEKALDCIASRGVIPVTMGGDGAVSLPQLRTVSRYHPDLVVVHIDAHTDTFPGDGAVRERYNTATTFTRAAEEDLVDVSRSFHIGARGPTYLRGGFEHTRGMGYQLISGAQMKARGVSDVLDEVRATVDGRPVYLCFDMDFFDPSCAPGVCTPAWGGASAGEGLDLLEGLDGLNFVAFDINTVSPPHDVQGMTAFLAATCMHRFLVLACRRLALVDRP